MSDRSHRVLAAAALLALAATARSASAETPQNACILCHGSPTWFGEDGERLVAAHRGGVHATAGIACAGCHGGNPDPALAADPAASMDPDYAPAPFVGAPSRQEVPSFCGRCHSDASFMRRFGTDIRTDQEREYRTSRHGIQLARGDLRVATCVDCHGVHGIERVEEPDSPVYPQHVAETCGHCHADPERMAGSVTERGTPLPVDQLAQWRSSVHGVALLERGDLSAPTCNDCHGDHGAAPPGVGSLSRVCGQCHGREAGLFRASPKREGFARHDAMYLPAAGPDGCVTCHPDRTPPARITAIGHFAECEACHGNHRVIPPNLTSLAPPAYPCLFCHGEPDAAEGSPEPQSIRTHYRRELDRLLEEADGRSDDALFDWLVDRMLELPAHTVRTADGHVERKPAFERLRQRFRIGHTRHDVRGPDGERLLVRRIRCTDCHGHESEGSVALQTAQAQLAQITQLTALVGRTERALLYARRRGVEVRESEGELDRAIDALIAQHALLHAFRVDPASAFTARHEEGMEHARAASAAARRALRELEGRRRGLGVALVLIALVLVGLAAKIRSLERSRSD